MKRIILNVDLEDNDIFEKEVEDAIRAEVRRMVRKENERMVREAASSEMIRIISGNEYGYKNILRSLIKEIAYESIKDSLKNMNIDEIVKEGIEERINARILWFSDIVDTKCKEVLDKVIGTEVSKKLKDILN